MIDVSIKLIISVYYSTMYLKYTESNVRTLKVCTFNDIDVNSDYTSYIKDDYTDYIGNNGAYFYCRN